MVWLDTKIESGLMVIKCCRPKSVRPYMLEQCEVILPFKWPIKRLSHKLACCLQIQAICGSMYHMSASQDWEGEIPWVTATIASPRFCLASGEFRFHWRTAQIQALQLHFGGCWQILQIQPLHSTDTSIHCNSSSSSVYGSCLQVAWYATSYDIW